MTNVLLDRLNPQQREAVEYGEGPMLVLAGAGSGKTRVIAHRVAYLIEDRGIAPEHILAVTFTNKAAQAMRERIHGLVRGRDLRHMTIRTFHALGLMILRELESQGSPFVRKGFSIYDDDDQRQVYKQCLEELGYSDDEVDVDQVRSRVSGAKAMLIGSEQYAKQFSFDESSRRTSAMYQRYERKLEANRAYDFDDLLLVPVIRLANDPACLAQYQARFLWVLVDEYQDVNHAQYRLTQLLTGQGSRNLCVVGDPDQSIYTWRGADVKNILEFERDYPDAKVIKLEQNYRSTQRILQAASEVIQHNRMRKDKTLWTEGLDGERLRLFQALTERDEAMFVSATIRRLLREGKSPQEVVVLYRTHAQSRNFEDAFLQETMPYRIFGGVRFYQRKEIKDLLAFLRLMLNGNDEVSFRRALQVAPQRVGLPTLKKIDEWGAAQGWPLLETVRHVDDAKGITSKTKGNVKAFVVLLNRLRGRIEEESLSAFVSSLLEETHYLETLKRQMDPQLQDRMENVQEFITAISEFEQKVTLIGAEALRAFMEHVSLHLTGEDGKLAEAITLMTVHNAKGLEFPVVFLTGMEEGMFPHFSARSDPHEMEEERRLCYVGLTRAKEYVYLTCAYERRLFGDRVQMKPSRFLAEIPSELIEELPSPVRLMMAQQRSRWADDFESA